ncbi:MAG: hypothetical protein K9L78_00640 [Victivallales bacterium]|nr:hypothetical protein [Victivallales bacterium]MCF7888603.1 hypothetical protein [Victivallales bacterium]
MYRKTYLTVFCILFSAYLVADSSGLNDFNYGNGNNRGSSDNLYQANKYKNEAEKLKLDRRIDSSAPKNVREVLKTIKILEHALKKTYTKLATAYEENNPAQINKLKLLVWKIKERIKIGKQKLFFENQISEFKKALKEYPDSKEMKKLIADASADSGRYIKLSKQILKLKERQKLIKRDIEKKNDEARIIRQKEVLKNMQKVHSNKYSN